MIPATVAFVVAMLLHGADHQIRGTGDLTTEVMAGGTVLFALAALTLWAVLTRRPQAPLVAAVVGITTTVSVLAAHLAPQWSAFSDPYPDKDLGLASWAAMLSEPLAAAVLAVVALRVLRRRQPAAAAA